MSPRLAKLLVVLLISLSVYSLSGQTEPSRITSTIDSSRSPELVLIQEFTVNAPVAAVWDAYTTKEGWESWAVPVAEVDFKVGGTIKTHYDPDAQIGDENTIVTHIISYAPQSLITLQAEITDNFPEFMKKEAKDFYNTIYFTELADGQTHVQSLGVGYKNTPKYLALMNYFIPANEQTLMKLIEYLEGER